MLANGEVRITLQGKGFGFDEEAIVVSLAEVYTTDEFDNQYLADTVTVQYDCNRVALGYRDSKVVCYFSPTNLLPDALRITLTVTSNDLSTSATLLSKYIQ